jgi:hypothetical protein
VLLSLADSTGRPGGWTWPSIPELMSRTGLGERAVQLATADLAAIGELQIQRNAGPGGCHRYRITMKAAGTPAESAGAQILRGPKAGTTRRARDAKPSQVKSTDPADSAPPQNLRSDPAESAGGTVSEPKENQSSTKTGEKPAKHPVADGLAEAFWKVHQSSTAQTFISVRSVIRTAIANGLPRNDVARALDRLAKEGRAVSGGNITTALAQLRGTPPQNGRHQPYRNPANQDDYDTQELRPS